MPKQLQNHQLAAQSTTPHPNQPQAATNAPSPMDQLAEQFARIQARFDSSPAGCASRGRSLRRRGIASAAAAQKSQSRVELGRYRRKCLICAHPDRDAIEELFLHWHNPEWISRLFDLDNIAPIYRHAHATGLYARRRSNLRMSLEHLIEQADATECTGAVIVRAVRAYACLTDSGEWVEPASRVAYTSEFLPGTPPPAKLSALSSTAQSHNSPVGATLVHPEKRRGSPAPASPEQSRRATQAEGPGGTRRERSRTAQPEQERGTGSQPVRSSSSLPPAHCGEPAQSSPAAAGGGEAASTNNASFASRSLLQGSSSALPASSRKPPASRTAISNRKQKLLETSVSRSKQNPELISNRKKIADNRGHADDAEIAK
ncbi:MAG TPA: hypothetical protein VGR72_14545 [Candidatus Acidoferrales bacterium]|nr:hypothetical protein [Candidatus Acidoferrales bacterium]